MFKIQSSILTKNMCIQLHLYTPLVYVCMYVYRYIGLWVYMVTRSAAPPLPPSMVYGAGCPPPPVGWSVGSLLALWGGCGGFGVLGLA